MKEFSDTYFVNKNFREIYKLLMEDFSILPSILNILEYKKTDWENNKRKEYIKIQYDDIPDIISKVFLNNSKLVNLKIKNSKEKFNDEEIIIKSSILPSKFGIISKLNLFKLKVVYHLKRLNESKTLININVISKVFLDKSFDVSIEQMIIDLFKIISNDTILQLHN